MSVIDFLDRPQKPAEILMTTQSSAVREAAERYRANAYLPGHFGSAAYRNAGYITSEDGWADRMILSNWAVEQIAADDDLPITAEWIVSIGAKSTDHKDKFRFYRSDYSLKIGLWSVVDGWKVMLEHREEWATCIVRGLKTRDDLRNLARALRIELKESK